jgi:putative endonuclease
MSPNPARLPLALLAPPEAIPLGQGHYVYVLVCADGALYTGYAVNIPQRLAKHQAGSASKCTRSRLPVRLAGFWAFGDRREALQAEHAFKQLTRLQKVKFLPQNPLGSC